MKYNILIGGAAGQGIESISFILEKTLLRNNYHIFSNKDYMSRVRGGHNFTQVRFSKQPLRSHATDIDAIVALNEETIKIHINNLSDDGIIIADNSINYDDKRFRSFPLKDIAKEVGNERAENIVALGVLIKSFNIDTSPLNQILRETFKEKFFDSNFKAFNKGHKLANISFKTETTNESENILINGNDALALGAIAGGLSFYAGYPMTPSTGIISYIVSKRNETGVFFEQAEDEIAAINMALGASFAGARSMTGSSGGGLSLMVESLGLTAMMETPLVVVDVQRPGPATGLPTRTEQGDLSFLLTASHGDIPRMVISLKNPEDAFYQAIRALNLADKYQLLVIILSDQFLADSKVTTKPFDFSDIKIERHITDVTDITDDIYKRYKLTEDGISKRLIPGVKGQIVITDSDEHTEYGHITESSEVRTNMMNKRMNKLKLLKSELKEPEFYGDGNLEHLLIGWGSTQGIIKDAVDLLNNEDLKVGALLFGDLYPLPTKNLEKYTRDIKNVINIEQNYSGQLAKLIRQETGIHCNKSILKYDGRQISAGEIVEKFKGEILNA